MDLHEQEQVARAFGVTPALVPLLPQLLADIWVLGSWPERIVELLREATPLAGGATALDLGCGKGAVSVILARDLRYRVRGVDLFPPFLQEAEERAATAGVADLCRFEMGDLQQTARQVTGCDVVVLAGVGADLFGDYARCVGELRRTVRAGGYLVIDDGFLTSSTATDRPGYEYCRSRGDTVRELTAHGDALAGELRVPRAELEEYNRRNTELIRARAEELAAIHPDLDEELVLYVRSEEAECEFLENETTAAIWLLERR